MEKFFLFPLPPPTFCSRLAAASPPPPPLTMWEMWFWVGGEKETEKQKCWVSSCGRPFSDGAEHWGYHGILPPPSSFLSFLLLFFFALLCNVHHRRHGGARYCCCCIQVCACSSSRIQMCTTSCHTFCGRGKTLREHWRLLPKMHHCIRSLSFLGGGERSVEYSRALRAPQFCKTDRPTPPRWMQPSDAFCPHPEPPHTSPTLRKIMKKGAKT